MNVADTRNQDRRKIAHRAVIRRRVDAQTEISESGIVTLVVPKRSLISRRRRFHRVDLDEIGSMVWDAADGETTVGQIIRRIARKTGRPVEATEEALFAFLAQMTSRSLLALTVESSAG